MSVAAAQIIERLRIRANNLERILAEELEVGTRLTPFQSKYPGNGPDLMGLENLLLGKQSELSKERRQQDTECWRDLVQIMRDLMNAWEGLSGLQAKQRFLQSIPQTAGLNAPYGESHTEVNKQKNDRTNDPYYQSR